MKSMLAFSIDAILDKDLSPSKDNVFGFPPTQDNVTCGHQCYFIQQGSIKSTGRVTLWEFLLELLANPSEFSHIIKWEDSFGNFTFLKPECVAERWGFRKQRENMTFDKLSRCLRYYYAPGILTKVPGTRFTYKFHYSLVSPSAYYFPF